MAVFAGPERFLLGARWNACRWEGMRMRFVIVLVALWPMLASAQIVPQGATPDVVVKTLGTARSRRNRNVGRLASAVAPLVVGSMAQTTLLSP